jgi:NitT/TauT family transport system permease protein
MIRSTGNGEGAGTARTAGAADGGAGRDRNGTWNAALVSRKVLDILAPLVLTAILIMLWEISVPLFGISYLVLPPPSVIGERMVEALPLLLKHTRVTLLESVYGFLLSVAIAVPLAVGIHSWRMFEKSVYPILVVLNTVPKVALAPILVLWFGYDWAPKIVVAFLIAFFPVVISTVVGLKGLDEDMVHLARSMRATPAQTFFKIRLPAALPSIFGGFKVGITLAVIGAVIGEYVAAQEGLGYLQLLASSEFDSPLNYSALIFIAGMGVVLFFTMELLERIFVRQR